MTEELQEHIVNYSPLFLSPQAMKASRARAMRGAGDESLIAFTTKRTLGRDRERICAMLGIPASHLVMPHQVHGDKIQVVDKVPMDKELLEGKDAVITNLKGVCIGVSTADCIPVLLYDEEHSATAAIHAGWRGTVARIVQKTIRLMGDTYGTRPEALKAVIGPGISLKNFEVGDEVYEIFEKSLSGNREQVIGNRYSDFRMEDIAIRTNKWHIDLKECNRQQLVALGVRPENIEVSPICTYDSTDQFFSARVEQKGPEKCGRNFNAIMNKGSLSPALP